MGDDDTNFIDWSANGQSRILAIFARMLPNIRRGARDNLGIHGWPLISLPETSHGPPENVQVVPDARTGPV
jgi:hypothetical protein